MSSYSLKIAVAFVLALPATAFAGDLATGAEITAAVSGNTVTGGMTETGAYTEFYSADGSIKADGYNGLWTIDGDTMCFSYDGSAPDCFGVKINGDAVAWIQDGEETGTGTIQKGNPNNY